MLLEIGLFKKTNKQTNKKEKRKRKKIKIALLKSGLSQFPFLQHSNNNNNNNNERFFYPGDI